MIPTGITKEHILQAIKLAASKPYSPIRDEHTHRLIFQGDTYPVKVVIDLAELVLVEGEVTEQRAREYLQEKKSEFNAVQAKQFLLNLGFPVSSGDERNADNFFQQSDLAFFKRMAGRKYDVNDPVARNAGYFISGTVWDKSWEWGKRITDRYPLKLQRGKYWLDRGKKGDPLPMIKRYTWYKLKAPGALTDRIFYTVGVSGPEQQLILKIDCQRNGESALTPAQVAAFDGYIAEKEVDPLVVEYGELADWSWNRLLERSLLFIESTIDNFHAVTELIGQLHESVYARICYNFFGWTEPSGRQGKSNSPRSGQEFIQERDYGFAPDEWLFDFDNIAEDGYHYARIEPLTPLNHVGKVYDIIFYTINHEDSTWYWVGEVKGAEVVDPDLSKKISEHYKNKGWLDQQLSQLKALEGVVWKNYEDLEDAKRFNIRFKVENCTIFDYRPFAEGERIPNKRYNLTPRKSVTTPSSSPALDGLNLTSPGRGQASTKTIGRHYKAAYRELLDIHGEIQDAFMQRFPQEFPALHFYSEVRKNGLYHRIDMVACDGNQSQFIFYEVKTYPSVMQSIRVALGQLLEYAFYPKQKLCKEFYIVSHLRANEQELQYLQHLSEMLSASFGFIHFDRKSEEFETLC